MTWNPMRQGAELSTVFPRHGIRNGIKKGIRKGIRKSIVNPAGTSAEANPTICKVRIFEKQSIR